MRLSICFVLFGYFALSADDAYVTNITSELTVIDIQTHATSQVTVSIGAQGVAFHPQGDIVYVANNATNTISVIDTTTFAVSTITVDSKPFGIAFNPDGQTAFVTHDLINELSVIDVSSSTVLSTIALNTTPKGVAFTPDGTKAYVANFGSNNVAVIDVSGPTVSSFITVGNRPLAVAVSPDGQQVYVVNSFSDTVSVIESDAVSATITVGSSPFDLAFSTTGELAYVTNNLSGTVSIIDTSSQTTSLLIMSNQASGIAITPDGTEAYVALIPFVQIVNLDDNTLGAQIGASIATTAMIATPTSFINYISTMSGNWSTATNWSPQIVPDNPNLRFQDARAQFLTLGINPQTVTLDTSVTLNGLSFVGNQSYTINANVGDSLSLVNNPQILGSIGIASNTINAPISLSSDSLTIDHNGNGNLTLSGAISGMGGLIQLGLGAVILSGTDANTFLGITDVQNGTLTLSKTGVNAVGGDTHIEGGILTLGAAGQFPTSSTVTLDSGTFDMNGNATTIGTFIFNAGTFTQGAGILTLSSASNALTMRNTLISGSLSLTGGGSIVFDSTNNGTAMISDSIDLGGNTVTFDIDDGSDDTDMLVGGAIDNGAITKSGMGSLLFNGSSANTFAGLTTVQAGELILSKTGVNAIGGDATITGGTLQLGADGQFPTTSIVTVNGGTFDLNGHATTIGNLDGMAGTQVLLGSGTLTAGSTGTHGFAGQISGTSGNLIKAGVGTLTLSGTDANTFTGLTTVQGGTLILSKTGVNAIGGNATITGGTLQLGADGQVPSSSSITLNSGSFDLNSHTTTIGNLNGMAGTQVLLGDGHLTVGSTGTHAGQLSGSIMSELSIESGVFTLSGDSSGSFLGQTQVDGGTFVVTGNISASTVFVQSGASLRGVGTVGPTTIHNGGILWGGQSIGTLTITGDLNLDAGSQVIVEINSLGQSTRYDVSGDANLGAQTATLTVMPQMGMYPAGTTWTILQTGGVVNGEFAFTPPGSLPELMILPGANVIQLFLPNAVLVAIPTQNLSGNTLIVANYLNTLIDSPSMEAVLSDLMALSTDALIRALNEIDPLRISSSRFALYNTQFAYSDLISSRMANQRMFYHFSTPTVFAASNQNLRIEQLIASLNPYWNQTYTERDCQVKNYSVWFQDFGLFSHEDGKDTNPSFDVDAAGCLLALDASLDSLYLGGGVGYAKNNLKESSHFGRASSKTVFFVLYNSLYEDCFFFDWALWGSYSRVKNRRNISFTGFDATAKSTFDSWGITPHFTSGYTFLFCKGAIEPFVCFDWPVQFNESFREKYASALNMHVHSNVSAMLRSELGINFYEKLQWDGGLLITKETFSYINKEPFSVGRVHAALVGQPGSFTVETFQNNQNIFSPKVELFAKWDRGFFLSAMYQGEFGSGYRSNEIIGKIGCFF